MNTAIISTQRAALIVVTLSIFLLSACSGVKMSSDKATAPVLFTDFSENATFLLKQAELVNELESTEWELTAIQALIKEKQYQLADSIIEHLQKKAISTQQKNDLTLLVAAKLYAENKLTEAEQTMLQVNSSSLSESGKMFYLKLKLDIALSNKDQQTASDTLFVLIPLIEAGDEIQKYNDMLLTQLSLLPPEQLNKFKPKQQTSEESAQKPTDEITSDDKFAAELAKIEAEMDAQSATSEPAPQLTDEQYYIQGWYDLAALYQRFQLRTNQLLQALEAWELGYPNHPVLEHMPTQLQNIPEATPYQPTKIAVLLPLSGRFQKQATALQYGISHAYYQQLALREQQAQEDNTTQVDTNLTNTEARQQAEQSTTDETIQAETNIAAVDETLLETPYLQFYDTNKMTMQEIATQLKAQDIEFVIGPLLKPNLAQFLPLVSDIPVLALNGFPTETTQDDESANIKLSSIHYAFPLSPENEAQQAAQMIFQNHHKKPLLMVPNSNFGRRVSSAFQAQWNKLHQAQDGEEQQEFYPAETHYFTTKAQLAGFVDNAMQTNKSKQRINQMKAIVAEPLQTDIRSRRDIDAIYLVSKRSELILLKPFIAVATSQFAETIPLYASSRSHADDTTNTQNKELSGLTFSDISLLMSDNEIKQQLDTVLPKQSMGSLRLFALGYDSYNLIEQLKQLQVIEGYQFQGLVGELSLDNNNSVNSKLQWGRYQRGQLIEVTTSTPAQ